MMPTASRLVSSVLLAILAFVVTGQVVDVMPPSTDFGYFLPINIGLGVLVGWVWLGPNSGDGFSSAISIGLTSAAVLLFLGLFVQAANEMMRLAMRNRYDGFFDAIAGIFVEGVKFGQNLTMEMLVTLAVGGVVAGIAANWTAQRYS
ncbi:TrgA family protein [Roseobacteraceae bacterium S113]